jgi:hypothetical protein
MRCIFSPTEAMRQKETPPAARRPACRILEGFSLPEILLTILYANQKLAQPFFLLPNFLVLPGANLQIQRIKEKFPE